MERYFSLSTAGPHGLTFFQKLDGFDERLLSGEDYELGYRLSLAGGKVYTLTRKWVYHYPPKSFIRALLKSSWYEKGNAQVARKHPEAHYRIAFANPLLAGLYLLLRTLFLVPLVFIKISYLERKPKLCFRPYAALESYLGAWTYCLTWFSSVTRGLS